MGNDRLTRQELSWLLAQEARGAAKALREGVSALSQPPPPLNITIKEGDNVESTLDALDDAITLLSDLQQAPSRRGRIDLAALLCEVSPEARIAMSPGAGTEVFGDEAGLRRMLQVLVTQGHTASAGGTPDLSIRRSGSWIHVGVELGPDTAATVGTEYRWLSRMALRHGGRLELEGGMQWLILPADASAEEMTELRRELEQAQQLGEAYARELAAVFAAGDLPRISPTQAPGNEQLGFLVALSTALVRPLREVLGGIREGLQESDSKHREGERNLGLYVSAGYELIGELSRVSELALEEHREAVDLVSLARAAVQAAEARASRHGVKLELVAPEALSVKQRASGVELVVRSLLDHAIAATPRSGSVKLTLEARGTGARICVEDGGPTIPSSAFEQLIAGRIDPTSVGRPAGLWLLVAECVSGAIGTEIRIAEGPNFSVEFDLLPPPN